MECIFFYIFLYSLQKTSSKYCSLTQGKASVTIFTDPRKHFLREKQGERRQPDEQNDNENSPTAQQRSRQADTAYATSLAAPAYAPEAPAYTAPVEAAPVAPAEPAPAPKAEEKDAFGEYDDVINFIRKSKK